MISPRVRGIGQDPRQIDPSSHAGVALVPPVSVVVVLIAGRPDVPTVAQGLVELRLVGAAVEPVAELHEHHHLAPGRVVLQVVEVRTVGRIRVSEGTERVGHVHEVVGRGQVFRRIRIPRRSLVDQKMAEVVQVSELLRSQGDEHPGLRILAGRRQQRVVLRRRQQMGVVGDGQHVDVRHIACVGEGLLGSPDPVRQGGVGMQVRVVDRIGARRPRHEQEEGEPRGPPPR